MRLKKTRQVATRWTCLDEVLRDIFFLTYFSAAFWIIGDAQVGSSQDEHRARFGFLGWSIELRLQLYLFAWVS